MQVNYLGHWLLTHQLLAGQQHLHKCQGSAINRSQPAQEKQQSQSSALNRQKHDLHQHNINVVAGSNQQTQQSLASRKPQGTRVVMLASMTHSAGRLRFDDLHAKKGYSGFHRYADSKLAIMLAVREFAQRMDRRAASTSTHKCMAMFLTLLLSSSHIWPHLHISAVPLLAYCISVPGSAASDPAFEFLCFGPVLCAVAHGGAWKTEEGVVVMLCCAVLMCLL